MMRSGLTSLQTFETLVCYLTSLRAFVGRSFVDADGPRSVVVAGWHPRGTLTSLRTEKWFYCGSVLFVATLHEALHSMSRRNRLEEARKDADVVPASGYGNDFGYAYRPNRERS